MGQRRKASFELNGSSYVVVSTDEFEKLMKMDLMKALAIPDLSEVSVGYLVRQHRVKAGWSQAELGRRVQAGQKHIDRIENGEIRNPRKQIMDELRRELGPDFEVGLHLIASNKK